MLPLMLLLAVALAVDVEVAALRGVEVAAVEVAALLSGGGCSGSGRSKCRGVGWHYGVGILSAAIGDGMSTHC